MPRYRGMSLTEIRRDLHAHPETGWKEFRTTALVAEALEEREFKVHLGSDALEVEDRLGTLTHDEIAAARERAAGEGAPERFLEQMDGVTGLVAVKAFGDETGPTVGVRVDMDALERTEARDDDHRPAREGFASKHPSAMHACGHDGHTAIGVGIARKIDENGGFDGTLKLFFQPGEEGGKGGYPMSRTDHLSDVDSLFALHLGFGETGTIAASLDRPFTNAILEAEFSGEAAHAGAYPHEGRNAAQAMATAVQNLYAIPRHGDAITRINVGAVESNNPQNIIAEEVMMRLEVRAGTADANEYMLRTARRTLNSAAVMHDVEIGTTTVGRATTFDGDDELVAVVSEAAAETPGVDEVIDRDELGASEDASYLIRRVQEDGGTGVYVGIGATKASSPHTSRFDIDEDALKIGVDIVTSSVRRLGRLA